MLLAYWLFVPFSRNGPCRIGWMRGNALDSEKALFQGRAVTPHPSLQTRKPSLQIHLLPQGFGMVTSPISKGNLIPPTPFSEAEKGEENP
jgi:hypothetical protein